MFIHTVVSECTGLWSYVQSIYVCLCVCTLVFSCIYCLESCTTHSTAETVQAALILQTATCHPPPTSLSSLYCAVEQEHFKNNICHLSKQLNYIYGLLTVACVIPVSIAASRRLHSDHSSSLRGGGRSARLTSEVSLLFSSGPGAVTSRGEQHKHTHTHTRTHTHTHTHTHTAALSFPGRGNHIWQFEFHPLFFSFMSGEKD